MNAKRSFSPFFHECGGGQGEAYHDTPGRRVTAQVRGRERGRVRPPQPDTNWRVRGEGDLRRRRARVGSGMAAAGAARGLIRRGRVPFGPLPFKVSDRDRDRTYELVTARGARGCSGWAGDESKREGFKRELQFNIPQYLSVSEFVPSRSSLSVCQGTIMPFRLRCYVPYVSEGLWRGFLFSCTAASAAARAVNTALPNGY